MFSLPSSWFVKAWFPGGSVGKASARNVGPWFDPWDGKILWRRKWQTTPVLWPRKLHGWRSFVGYSPWSHRVRHDWATSLYLWFTHRFVVSTPLKIMCGCRRAERNYSTFKVRRGGPDEIPLVQGKGQWQRFPGADVNRYTMTKVRETQERQLVLWDGIRGQTHWDHNHRQLANLITWTTTLSNSMKIGHAMRPKADRSCWKGLTECGPLEQGMANHFSILALSTPWTVWKGKMRGYWKRNCQVG